MEKGLDIEAQDHQGNTPLSVATETHYEDEQGWYDHTAAIELLLDKGAVVNCVNKDGRTLLMHVVGRGPKVLKLLIDHGADLEVIDPKDQSTAFLQTAIHYDIQSAKLLADAGANIQAKDRFGNNVADKILDLVEVIIKKDVKKAKAYLAFVRDELGVQPVG